MSCRKPTVMRKCATENCSRPAKPPQYYCELHVPSTSFLSTTLATITEEEEENEPESWPFPSTPILPHQQPTTTTGVMESKTQWNPNQVYEWICGLPTHYAQYAQNFRKCGINGHMMEYPDEPQSVHLFQFVCPPSILHQIREQYWVKMNYFLYKKKK